MSEHFMLTFWAKMKEFCLNQVIIHVLPEQPRAHRSCSFASCDPRQSHHCLNCFYHNVPLFLPAAELLGGITSLPERSVLAEADVEQNKNHRFSLWNISGKHFFSRCGKSCFAQNVISWRESSLFPLLSKGKRSVSLMCNKYVCAHVYEGVSFRLEQMLQPHSFPTRELRLLSVRFSGANPAAVA